MRLALSTTPIWRSIDSKGHFGKSTSWKISISFTTQCQSHGSANQMAHMVHYVTYGSMPNSQKLCFFAKYEIDIEFYKRSIFLF